MNPQYSFSSIKQAIMTLTNGFQDPLKNVSLGFILTWFKIQKIYKNLLLILFFTTQFPSSQSCVSFQRYFIHIQNTSPSLPLLFSSFPISLCLYSGFFFAFLKNFVPFKLYYCIETVLFHFLEAYFSLNVSWRSLYISINASSVFFFFFLITTSIFHCWDIP